MDTGTLVPSYTLGILICLGFGGLGFSSTVLGSPYYLGLIKGEPAGVVMGGSRGTHETVSRHGKDFQACIFALCTP